MSSTLSMEFVFEDSLSSNDSNINDLQQDDNTEHMVLIIAAKELEDRANMNKRRRSMAVRVCVPRNRALGHTMLMQDYLAEVPTYPPHLFCRRYRLCWTLFVKILQACEENSLYFTRGRNDVVILGLSFYQKISAAMRVIAYGIPSDYTSDYLCIGQDTTTESI
jgi:hypothetical protein